MTYELVTKPDFDAKPRKSFLKGLFSIIQFTMIVVAVAFLSCILALLHCISVFAVSTAFEHFPTSEILISPS